MKTIMVALCFVFSVAACGPREPIDPVRVSENRIAAEQCAADTDACKGGFVAWKDGSIFRIDVCEGECGARELSIDWLRSHQDDDDFLNQIEAIVLPADLLRWRAMAVLHAQQFVMLQDVPRLGNRNGT